MRSHRVILDLDDQLNLVGVAVESYRRADDLVHTWCQPVGPFDTEWHDLGAHAATVAARWGQLTLF